MSEKVIFPRILIVDCDNTLVLNLETRTGSEELKEEAWYAVFPEWSRETLAPVLGEAIASIRGGVRGNRFDIARMVCQRFGIPDEDREREVVKRCSRYDEATQAAVSAVGVPESTRQFLSDMRYRRIPVYLATARPRESVVTSLRTLGLLPHFTEIYGYPHGKEEIFKKVALIEGVQPNEVLVVDDQPEVGRLAQSLGCRFALMYTARIAARYQPDNMTFPIIENFYDVHPLLGIK